MSSMIEGLPNVRDHFALALFRRTEMSLHVTVTYFVIAFRENEHFNNHWSVCQSVTLWVISVRALIVKHSNLAYIYIFVIRLPEWYRSVTLIVTFGLGQCQHCCLREGLQFSKFACFFRIMKCCHRTLAMGVARRQGTLTPPETWSRPIWDLHMFYLLRQILFRTFLDFSGLCHRTSNIPLYCLDFASYNTFWYCWRYLESTNLSPCVNQHKTFSLRINKVRSSLISQWISPN